MIRLGNRLNMVERIYRSRVNFDCTIVSFAIGDGKGLGKDVFQERYERLHQSGKYNS